MKGNFFKKLSAIALGVAMAIGIGVAVGSNSNAVQPAHAAGLNISIDEETTGTSYESTNFYISDGGVKAEKQYQVGSSTLTTKSSYNIDSTQTISYTIKTRKYGGPDAAQAVVNLNLICGSAIVATASYSPSDTTLRDCSGTFTVTGDTSDVEFEIKGNGTSGGGKGVAISEIHFSFFGTKNKDYIKDKLVISTFGINGTGSYAAFTDKSANNGGHSDAVYLGCSARNGNDTKYNIQLNTGSSSLSGKNYYRGIASSTSGGVIRKIRATWATQTTVPDNRSLDVYGSNTAYSSNQSDYKTNGEKIGSVAFVTNETFATMDEYIAKDYKYVAIVAIGGVIYMDQIDIFWEEPNKLSSVEITSDPTSTLTAGTKFAFDGELTAHYTKQNDEVVTPTAYKFGASDIDPTTSGTAITTDTTLNRSTHNGKTIYVLYTYEGITKYDSYVLTVAYAPITSFSISVHAISIGYFDTYDYREIEVTIEDATYSNLDYEWIVNEDDTTTDDYIFDSDGFMSGETDGVVVLRCRSTFDNTKYDELTITISNSVSASFTLTELSGYTGKDAVIDFTYSNIPDSDVDKIVVSSTSDAIIVEDDLVADSGYGMVTITFESAVNSAELSITFNGGPALDTMTVTVIDDYVTSLTWNAPTINVYSGATLSTTNWNVHYAMASGDEGDLATGYDILLGNEVITSDHTWVTDDDGKVLNIRYLGYSSLSSTTVHVTQTLRDISAATVSPTNYTLTSDMFDSKKPYETSLTVNSKTWAINYVWKTTAPPESKPGFSSTKGMQFGTASYPLTSMDFSTSGISGTIKEIVVNTSGANSINCALSVKVGTTDFTYEGEKSVKITADASNYTFKGTGSGTITVTWTNSSSKAIYVNGFVVGLSNGSSNIANAVGHEAAQAAVVRFAKRFNAAMGTTNFCKENMSTAWENATKAYTNPNWESESEEKGFLEDIALLSEEEQNYAKSLIENATAMYTNGTDSDYSYCLERAMKTYEICVTTHDMTPFMKAIRPLGSNMRAMPVIRLVSQLDAAPMILIVVGVITLTAVGGYYYLKHQKGKKEKDI